VPALVSRGAPFALDRLTETQNPEELLRIINQSHGLSRGEILDKMGLKGNKSGEMSVSNALTALTKSKQVTRRDRKYVAS